MNRAAHVYSLFAGAVSAIGSATIDVHFWQALIIAGITGILTAGGAAIGSMLAARINAESNERLHAKLEDVQGAVGAKRRREDTTIE